MNQIQTSAGLPKESARNQSAHTANGRLKRLDQLPSETLQNIIGYVDSSDLLTLQTLSQYFHFLASAELYRNLDFNITCAEADDRGAIASRAADALQTINTSEHDYAQHVKSFRLGLGNNILMSSGLNPPESYFLARVVFDSKSDASKFLNTSVLQLVRRASILESFRWDVPIELSGTVYQALQKLASLRYLHVRLDVLPAPRLVIKAPNPISHPPPPPPGIGNPPVLPHSSSVIVPPVTQFNPRGQNLKRKKAGGSPFWANRRSFSGFKGLSALKVIRLASLDSLVEIRHCIRASSASLKCLTVTLDPASVATSRRNMSALQPQDLDDLSDTEPEDDEIFYDSMSPTTAGPQPANEADLRQAKSAQEGILSSLFDLENCAAKGNRLEERLGLPGGRCLVEEDQTALDAKLESIMKSLNKDEASTGQGKLSDSVRLEKYKLMRELADLAISKHAPKSKKTPKSDNKKPLNVKKPYKGAKPKAPKSGPPAMPDTNDALSNFNFEEFLDKSDGPLSPNSTSGVPGSNVWTSSHSKKPYNNNTYTNGPPPLLPYSGGASSSLDFSGGLTWPSTTSSSLDSLPPLPYSSNLSPSGTGKASAYNDNDQNSYFSPYGSDPYKNTSMKAYSKHLAHKKKSSAKGGSQPPPPVLDKYSQPNADGSSSKGLHVFSPSISDFPTSSLSTIKGPKDSSGWEDQLDKPTSAASSLESDNDTNDLSQSESSLEVPFFAASSEASQLVNDGIDVDMDHPDEDQTEALEDQESLSGTDDTAVMTPRKRVKPLGVPESLNASALGDLTKSSSLSQAAQAPRQSDTEKMHEYIRTAHGLQLEELQLHYIPMKASIVAKALDLTVLQRITLLDTGPQDSFWALLVKLTNSDAPIRLKSIHTDHVSFSLLKYLASFDSLEELLLHERRAKVGANDSDARVAIASIRKQALRPHLVSLKRIMLRNERNDSWDLDLKTLHLLALQANNLEELAVNLKTPLYHSLLQIFPAFKSLRALHLITLRGSDRNNFSMQLETLAYTIDSLAHCPDLNIKYIAIAENLIQISGHKHFRKQLKKMMDNRSNPEKRGGADAKGKGKAVEPALMDLDEVSDDDMDEKLANVQLAQRKLRTARRFDEIKSVKIFSPELRVGRL